MPQFAFPNKPAIVEPVFPMTNTVGCWVMVIVSVSFVLSTNMNIINIYKRPLNHDITPK